MNLKQILTLAQKHGFLSQTAPFTKGPIGSLLLENLKFEWINSLVNNKEIPVFYNTHGFVENYEFVKEICSQTLPYGLADITKIPKLSEEVADNKEDFSKFFKDFNYLRCTMFVSPDNSLQFFHQWQRMRRVWWRKFSPTPGRYFTTDIQTDNGLQSLDIIAKYPWGTQLVETLGLSTEKHPLLSYEQLLNGSGKKVVQPHYLTSTINQSVMYLNTICDAFEELTFQDKTRVSFRFHRKLAPYKISFAVSNNHSVGVVNDLRELAQYICKKLRANNVTSLLLPSLSKISLDKQFHHFDHIGVPYTVVLNENTLKNGVIFLRSRDTTLKEEVHVTELPNYVELLFKNY